MVRVRRERVRGRRRSGTSPVQLSRQRQRTAVRSRRRLRASRRSCGRVWSSRRSREAPSCSPVLSLPPPPPGVEPGRRVTTRRPRSAPRHRDLPSRGTWTPPTVQMGRTEWGRQVCVRARESGGRCRRTSGPRSSANALIAGFTTFLRAHPYKLRPDDINCFHRSISFAAHGVDSVAVALVT